MDPSDLAYLTLVTFGLAMSTMHVCGQSIVVIPGLKHQPSHNTWSNGNIDIHHVQHNTGTCVLPLSLGSFRSCITYIWPAYLALFHCF